jgi:oxygen-independent coproporphyrinogen-3 oxidase
VATQAERLPEKWLAAVERNGSSLELSGIAPADAAREHLLMHVRLAEGLDLSAYRARWGRAPAHRRLARLSELGLIVLEGDRLHATPRGRLVLNSVIAQLADFAEGETAMAQNPG